MVHIHKFVVHYDEDVYADTDTGDGVVLCHGWDLLIQVCDRCLDKFKTEYGHLSYTNGSIFQTWSCCHYCRIVNLGAGEKTPSVKESESRQLEFEFMRL